MRNTLEERLDTLNRAGAETTEKVDVLLGIAKALGSNDPQRVRRLAQEAHDLAERLAYPQGQGQGLGWLAFAAYIESDHETAYTYFNAALDVFEALDDPYGKSWVLGRLALLQMSLGDYDRSLASGFEALRLSRQLGDVVEQASALMVCGTGYSDLGAYDRALRHFEEALTLLDDGTADVIQARTLSGMGTVYHKKGDYEKALAYHQQSLTLFKEVGNRLGEARALNDLGIVYTHLGDEEQALDYHQRSLHIREQIGHRQSQSTSLIHLGNLYLQRGEVEASLEHLHRALTIAEAVKVRLRVYQAHLGLARAYERQGRLAEALDHHKAYHRVHEEVMGEEARIKLNNMQIRFEVEKAEQTAEIERLRSAELKEKNDELRRVLQELKTMQAQLIHAEKMASLGQLTAGIAHEIKNPLNFVNNFAQLSQELSDELEEALAHGDDVAELLADLKQNAARIAHHGERADAIVRAMMLHAQGGTGERNPMSINALVEEYVNLAYHGMRASRSDFTVVIERCYGEEVGMAAVQGQELSRVLLNLLSNAFDAVHEHARQAVGPYTPTVRVGTQVVGRSIEIRVSDNGPGIPLEIREKIFEPFFTTKPTGSGTGLGLSLSYDIITQGHGGTLKVESIEGQGATFVVTLPAAVGRS